MRPLQHRLTTRIMLLLLALLVLAACSFGQPAQTGGLSPTQQMTPSPTLPVVPRTTVTFSTQDHVKLAGYLYGSRSATAIICSHESRGSKSNWGEIAPRLAAQGFLVLAFDFRSYGDSEGTYDGSKLDRDMRAALAFVRSQGAKKVILLGASLGAIISLMVAKDQKIAGVISLSGGYYHDQAPPLLLAEQVKAIAVPRLFIASEQDSWVDETLRVYLDASSPKELHLYPGMAHGTAIASTENGSDLIMRILTFVTSS
jgi:dienelactone hydrolase